jgi:endonuclease/exonuclease/phosphatase family metal-dependent hydrolase
MSYLQIASWNIEHLSGASRAERKQSCYALVDHIEMAGVDILAMQELYVTNIIDGTRRNEDLDRVCELLAEHKQGDWVYEILPNRNSNDVSQLCGLLWNRERVSKTDSRQLEVDHRDGDDPLWDRTPHAVKFSMLVNVWRKVGDGEWAEQEEQRSVVIVPLHMKSNYGGQTVGKQVRKKEADTLCAHLHEATDLDPSLILIGDTNCLSADEPAIETFIEYGLIDLNNNDAATYWSREYGESPFDRAFVASGRAEFKYSRQYVLRSSDLKKHDRYLSDHYMIKLSVKTYLDDSDPRD